MMRGSILQVRLLRNLIVNIHRRGARDWRDKQDELTEMEAQSVHFAPFSHVSRFSRHGA